jgi:nucleoside permease NupC
MKSSLPITFLLYLQCANIPVACWLQSESPLLFKPFIKDLTKSEMHAIMTEGFATVAGKITGNIHGYIMMLSG